MIKYISTDLDYKSGGERGRGGARLGVWAAVPEMGSSKIKITMGSSKMQK